MSLRSLALLSLCVFLTACNKINQENYSQLKSGMAKAEVEKLLGAPTDCSAPWACPAAPGATRRPLSVSSTPVTKC